MTGVEIAPEFRAVLDAAGLNTFESLMAVPAANVVRAVPGRSTVRVELPGLVGYLKRYEPSYLSPIKKLLRAMRWPGADDEAAREWRKINLFRELGFLSAAPVALGQQRQGGIVVASFLLQQEIGGGVPAEDYIQTISGPRRWELLRQIGRLARQLRDAGLIHKDLNFKHIFVVERGAAWDLYLIDLQRVLGPRHHRERWYIKDAASLAYSAQAHGHCSRTDVLRLYQAYRPGPMDKAFIRHVWKRVLWLQQRRPKYQRVWNAPGS
jgi:tRNA A-37 threonylcarbamoyl transferase component Bud32